jgi:hypothetical protein
MNEPEVWLRGPVAGIAPLLQPVAHSLLQSHAELTSAMSDLTVGELRARPGGVASIEYHARHAAGSLDRLTTYARGESLSAAQLAALADEQVVDARADAVFNLVAGFHDAVERALAQLRDTAVESLTDPREVGRARLPSTVVGLLVHAAEHTQRHVGQLMTTTRIVKGARGIGRSAAQE